MFRLSGKFHILVHRHCLIRFFRVLYHQFGIVNNLELCIFVSIENEKQTDLNLLVAVCQSELLYLSCICGSTAQHFQFKLETKLFKMKMTQVVFGE